MLTSIEILAVMMFGACVEYPPHLVKDNIYEVYYECPLIGDKAEFVVWVEICSKEERYAVAIADMRNNYGFVLNKEGEINVVDNTEKGLRPFIPYCKKQK